MEWCHLLDISAGHEPEMNSKFLQCRNRW